MTCNAVINPAFNSVEITFPGIPSASIRDTLKSLRYRWHATKKLWYGYTDVQTVSDALTAAGVTVNPAPDTTATNSTAPTADVTAAEPATVQAATVPGECINSLEIKHPGGMMYFAELSTFFPMTQKDFKLVLPLLKYVATDTLQNFYYTLKLYTTAPRNITDVKRLASNIAALEKSFPQLVTC